ncbi:MAG: hypothetical protein WC716_13080 [Chitinophagaceae bacterium]|jgi:hypothetical protein
MRFLLSAMLILICCSAGAQSNQSKKNSDYTKKPLWIAMMDDPNANFFETEKAFELYWSKHEKPEGEHEEIGERAEREKTPGKRKQRKISAENDLRFAMKKYEVWHDQTLPYVQPDGRILSTEERLKIWKSQQQQ